MPDELINHLEQTQSGLILASLICKEDLIQIATLIKLIKKNKQPATKVVVINFSRDRNYEKAMALFYIGQASYLKAHVLEAKGSYARGLSLNNIHYKCLVGLFEVLMKDNKLQEAYQVVKKIFKYFPANPDRLAQIVRLAIQTKNFEDMELYYEIFTSLDERNQDLVNYIGAGMYISGKYCLLNGKPDKALEFFDNVAVSCSEFTKFTRAKVTLLIEHGREYDAANLLGRFPPGTNDHEDYLVSNFLVSTRTTADPNKLVKTGLDIYNRNIRDFHCLKFLVQNMKKLGYGEDKLAPFQEEIRRLWPDKSNAVLPA